MDTKEKYYHVEIFDGKTGAFKGVLSAGNQTKTVFSYRTAQKYAAEMTAKNDGNFYQVIYKNDGAESLELYAVEFTDTFSGEANYCWVQRFAVWAKDIKKAATLAKQHRYGSPVPRHDLSEYGGTDDIRIDIKGANVCAFLCWLDPEEHDKDHHGEIINGSE